MRSYMKPIDKATRFAGPALTARTKRSSFSLRAEIEVESCGGRCPQRLAVSGAVVDQGVVCEPIDAAVIAAASGIELAVPVVALGALGAGGGLHLLALGVWILVTAALARRWSGRQRTLPARASASAM